MRFLAPFAVGVGLSGMVGIDAALLVIGCYAAWMFLVERKPARIYRRSRR